MRLSMIMIFAAAALQGISWLMAKKPSLLQHLNLGMWPILAVVLLALYYRQRDGDAMVLSESGLTYQQGAFTRSIPLQSITAITQDPKHLIVTGEDGRIIKKLKSSMYEDPERLVTAFAALREKPGT